MQRHPHPAGQLPWSHQTPPGGATGKHRPQTTELRCPPPTPRRSFTSSGPFQKQSLLVWAYCVLSMDSMMRWYRARDQVHISELSADYRSQSTFPPPHHHSIWEATPFLLTPPLPACRIPGHHPCSLLPHFPGVPSQALSESFFPPASRHQPRYKVLVLTTCPTAPFPSMRTPLSYLFRETKPTALRTISNTSLPPTSAH